MKNHYTLNAGEFYAAQEILKRRKDLELCFPLKDTGWDLYAIKRDGSKGVRIQVKESRVYRWGNSWHQLKCGKLDDADVFVFVSYIRAALGARSSFELDFVVIPSERLKELCQSKRSSKGKYSFYFVEKNGRLVDRRESKKNPKDVSEFHRAWHLI